MVSLHDIREHVASLFIMLNKKTVILFRIEFLVVLVTLVFFAMFLMDFYRRIIHNSFMRAVFSVFDAVSDSIVVYLLGAMQTAPFKNQLFPVWALVLVNFRYSADYISGYGVPDRRGRRFTEWRNVFKLLGSAFLNWTRGSSFWGPLWLVWELQIVRSGYRFLSHTLASRAVWHGGSSELVAEHMRAMHERGDQVSSSSRGELFNPVTMEGYRYLVYGETKQKKGVFRLKKPQYALSTDQDQQDATKKNKKTSPPPLITLDTISRLLRCRFEDVKLQRCIFDTNRDLVKSIIAGKVGASDALRIMELQLAFVHDYFNTRYPMIFWCGLPSLFISLVLSVLTMGAVVWLAVDIHLNSNKVTDRRWHGLIDQYVFVESYDDRPRFWNLIHNLTTGIVPKKEDGAKLGSAVQVPDCVRQKVLEKLSELTEDNGDGRAGRRGQLLPGFIKTLSDTSVSMELQRYQAYTARPSSATTGGGGGVVLPTASHIILVWHIATSLCEMELATTHGVDLGSPGFPCSLLSWLSSLCSSKPYLMDVYDKKGCCSSSSLSWFTISNCCCSSSKSSDGKTEEKKQQVNGKLPAGNLRRAYIIANSLSRYCTYLLVSKPDLIPDSFLVPKIVFQKAVRSARDGIFKGTGSLQERHKALKALMDEAGEFINHVWALLWHCGIQESSLWPKDTSPENNEPQPQVGNGGGDGAAAGMIEKRRTGGDAMRERDHIGITIDEAHDNKDKGKGAKDLEAGDSSTTSTGLLKMEGTESSEIEEVYGDATTNVQRGMARQTQN
ncbi:unnamed protein product [Miscanthus lutarioriparius]|uniref:DUF4220 domain-containing protein n=1 Tax=Miscanthus lutarioriparius TaxID=422564 RepID=A0A811RG51_9POAL|nr:unnamed protein product [Miscanthus lutarioriparius]